MTVVFILAGAGFSTALYGAWWLYSEHRKWARAMDLMADLYGELIDNDIEAQRLAQERVESVRPRFEAADPYKWN